MDAAPRSQTLDRGLRALEAVAAAPAPLSVAEVAAGLGVDRAIAYRLLRTLEDHRLAARGDDGRYTPGLGLPALARSVRRDVQAAALPELTALAGELRMTAFLVVRDRSAGRDEAVTVASVEPPHTAVHVAYAPGARHPVDRGAPGLALLAGAATSPDERPEVDAVRRRGWAESHGEVLAGLSSVAAPVLGPDGGALAAVAVVHLDSSGAADDRRRLGERVLAAALAVTRALT